MKVLISESNLTKIADAIRNRLGVEDRYTPNNMGATIQDSLMRMTSNGTIETYMAADTAYGRVRGGNFVEKIVYGTTNPVNKISDIEPFIIRSVKLSSNKVLVSWVTKYEENNKITAVVCTINNDNSVTAGNPITLPVDYVVMFDATLLTENTVIVGSLSNAMNITVLGIENTTITILKNKTFNEIQGYGVIRVAKKDNTHFVTAVGKSDGTVVMCMAMDNNGEPQKYGNTLTLSGAFTRGDISDKSIDMLVLNGNTCIIVISKNTGEGDITGLVVTKCAINDSGITKTEEVISSAQWPVWGQSQVSVQLLRDDREHSQDRIFILGGGTLLHPNSFAVILSINPTLQVLKLIGTPLFDDTTQYFSVDAIAVYENCVLCSFGGVINPTGKTKVMLVKVGLDNNLTPLITKEYVGIFMDTPVTQLNGSRMFISGAIPTTQQENPHVGASVFNFTYGVSEILHGKFYGIAMDTAENGKDVKVCVPNEEVQ
jgi:hypothetical protein